MPDNRLADAITTLALAAGAEIMKIFDAGTIAASVKADRSPVTAADLAADRVIGQGLASVFPDIPAVTEEAAESHANTGLRRYFLVDPLDGTRDFIQRRADFTVNIALIENHQPVAGVVYAPARARLWVTRSPEPMELGVADHALSGAHDRPIRVATPDNDGLRVVASKNHRDRATDDYISRFSVAEFKSAGSSLKFCLVAAGEADFYPRLGRTMEWDTAAGHAVLAAAGGLVLRVDNHRPLTYGKPGWENPHFLALAPGVEL